MQFSKQSAADAYFEMLIREVKDLCTHYVCVGFVHSLCMRLCVRVRASYFWCVCVCIYRDYHSDGVSSSLLRHFCQGPVTKDLRQGPVTSVFRPDPYALDVSITGSPFVRAKHCRSLEA